MQSGLELRKATVAYSGRAVLHDIDLSIAPGERVAVMGRSGAGKSTLLNLLYTSHAGDAALIPQAPSLVRTLSVFHNVYMGRLDRRSTWANLRTLAWPYPRDRVDVANVLALVGLTDKMFEQAGMLSGGQQQRTSVARALYNGRPIVIGDEPFSALDAVQAAVILDKLVERYETLVLAMHDVGLALSFATRVIVLDRGRIALDRCAREVAAQDLAPFYASA
jgi:phosphonate transport system ATP-binding protein